MKKFLLLLCIIPFLLNGQEPIAEIQAGETGLSTRTKINAVINKINSIDTPIVVSFDTLLFYMKKDTILITPNRLNDSMYVVLNAANNYTDEQLALFSYIETDPVYVLDSSLLKTGLRNVVDSINSLKNWVTQQNYLTSESDPVFLGSVAASITQQDTANWNAALAGGDGWGSQYVQTDNTLSGQGTYDLVLKIDTSIISTVKALEDTAKNIRNLIPDVSGFLTTETDPVYSVSAAAGITAQDLLDWDAKLDTETDPIFGASVAAGITAQDTANWNNSGTGGNPVLSGVTANDTTRWATDTYNPILQSVTTNDTTRWGSGEIGLPGTFNQSMFDAGIDNDTIWAIGYLTKDGVWGWLPLVVDTTESESFTNWDTLQYYSLVGHAHNYVTPQKLQDTLSHYTLTSELSGMFVTAQALIDSFISLKAQINYLNFQIEALWDSLGAVAPVGDTINPTILGFYGLQEDNSYVNIRFSELVWGNVDADSPITAEDFIIYGFSDGGATALDISDILDKDGAEITSGIDTIRVLLGITGVPDGTETFEIRPVNGSSVFDASGNPMASTSSTGTITLNDETEEPPVGDFEWTNVNNLNVSGLSVNKNSGGDAWGTGTCNSTIPLADGAYLQFRINDEWTGIAIGLDASSSYTAISSLDYAFVLDHPFEIYANYNNTGQGLAADMGDNTDEFRVMRAGNYIRLYQKIGEGSFTQVFQFTQEATTPLYVHIDCYGWTGINTVSYVTP